MGTKSLIRDADQGLLGGHPRVSVAERTAMVGLGALSSQFSP